MSAAHPWYFACVAHLPHALFVCMSCCTPRLALSYGSLWGVTLMGKQVVLKATLLWQVVLEATLLWQVVLEGTLIWQVVLEGTQLWQVVLEGTLIWQVVLKATLMWQVVLEGTLLWQVVLEGTLIWQVVLEGTRRPKLDARGDARWRRPGGRAHDYICHGCTRLASRRGCTRR